MNTFDFRRALPGRVVWPVDVAMRHPELLTIARTRGSSFLDDEIPDVWEFDADDDDVEYFRKQFRLYGCTR